MKYDSDISTPYVLTDDFCVRDEWSRNKVLFNKGDAIYGLEEDEYVVVSMYKDKAFIRKCMVIKTNTLECEGWEGPCDRNDAWKEHMNTIYEDEERNYATLCPECWKLCSDHWEERWAEYYSNCM